jgi:hypothetical protein
LRFVDVDECGPALIRLYRRTLHGHLGDERDEQSPEDRRTLLAKKIFRGVDEDHLSRIDKLEYVALAPRMREHPLQGAVRRDSPKAIEDLLLCLIEATIKKPRGEKVSRRSRKLFHVWTERFAVFHEFAQSVDRRIEDLLLIERCISTQLLPIEVEHIEAHRVLDVVRVNEDETIGQSDIDEWAPVLQARNRPDKISLAVHQKSLCARYGVPWVSLTEASVLPVTDQNAA